MTSSGADAYTVANREGAIDFMADYPEYGEQRWYTSAVAADGYGHRHPGQEEIYFVISGIVTLRIAGEVFEAFRSVHDDTDDEAELLTFSTRLGEPTTDKQDDFWASI